MLRSYYWFGVLAAAGGCTEPERKLSPVIQVAEEEERGGGDGVTERPPVASLGGGDFLPGQLLMAPDAGSSGFVSCLGETRQAEESELDLFVMLDTSGSMLDVLPANSATAGGEGRTKWGAVRDSLAQFVEDEATENIGIGLQYFPLFAPGVPLTCSSNLDCGAGGPCSNSVCLVSVELANGEGAPLSFLAAPSDGLTTCVTDAECSGQEVCRSWSGECVYPAGRLADFPDGASLEEVVNVPVQPLCAGQQDCALLPGARCESLGSCRADRPTGRCTAQTLSCLRGACSPLVSACTGRTSCDSGDYASPAVAIRRDGTRSFDIVESLFSQEPEGRTPTGPALGGALQHAKRWAETHPGRQVVTVFATDGLPTQCEPTASGPIADLAGAANVADQGVQTFVIGVFGTQALDELGHASLDQIAAAGGTEQALVIDTERDVTEEFLAALKRIRETAVSCDFQLNSEVELNFNEVNLLIAEESGAESALSKVEGLEECAETEGWYYVRDSVGRPSQIRVCPRTCEALTDEGASAELQIGCPTLLR